MAKNTSMTLEEHFESFLSEQITNGRYGSASEVIRAGLRLLENNETKLTTLRNLLQEGEKSGLAEYEFNAFIAKTVPTKT